MKEKTFTGADLEKALASGALTKSGVEVVGMVKSSQKAGHVSFTRAGCDTWVELPTSMIEQAEQLGMTACKDHSHPVFKITLKEANTPEAQLLAALLAQATPMPAPQGAMPPRSGPVPPMYAGNSGPGAYGNPFLGSEPEGMDGGFGFPPPQTAAFAGNTGGFGGGLNFGCSSRGCRCDGFWDCIDMINTNVCRGEVKCYTGWVTGQVVCTCSR